MHSLPLKLLAHTVSFTAQTFVAGLWQGFVLIAAVALAMRVLPRLSASARFIVWTATFALASALPMLHTHPSVATAHAALHVSPWIALGIAGLWAAMSSFRFAELVASASRLRGIWRRAIPVEVSADELALLATAGRRVELCSSDDVDAPSVIGFFAPRLLVPAALLPELTEGELLQIILHECEHLRRRDDWINLAQKMALALFPLNPALFWVDRRLGLERELACDAGVVARLASPFDYAHCLTRLAEHRLHSRRIALALSAWSRRSELARRVHTLLEPIRSFSPLQLKASLAILGVGLAAGSMEMARAPRLIAFTEAAPVTVAENAMPLPRMVPASYVVPARAAQQTAKTSRKVREFVNEGRGADAADTPAPRVELAKAHIAESPTAETASAATTAAVAVQALARPDQGRSRAVLASATQPRNRAHFANATADDAQDVYFLNDEPARARYAAVRFGDGWLIIQL